MFVSDQTADRETLSFALQAKQMTGAGHGNLLFDLIAPFEAYVFYTNPYRVSIPFPFFVTSDKKIVNFLAKRLF